MGPKTRALKVAAETLLLIAGFWLAQPIAFAASANSLIAESQTGSRSKGSNFFRLPRRNSE